MAKSKNHQKYQHSVVIPWPMEPRYSTTDPNETHRPWLEEHAGRQSVEWEWDLHYDSQLSGEDMLIVWFKDELIAVQFKLFSS